ncbi:Amino acid permease [Geodermatophilus pulveris]|uniref:Amino acid permease n=1 Tax=Geodermatophilus pulveris TaxID=1564159 RepID=A0A239FH78_9ACTN|nr:APC family permease [Geodermatophilus pulveris]SNS56390.1 Amino acid permease [Geodermatophilus pulveris]
MAPATAVLAAALLAYYSFVGFDRSANTAEEVRDVRRSTRGRLFGALLAAGAVYVLVGRAASVALPPDRLAASSGPLLEVVRAADAGVPDRLFSAVALVAVANGALLTMIMASRMAYGMAEQRLLPAVLGRVLPGRRTPWVAIAVTTAVAMGPSLAGDLTTLANTVVLLFACLSTNTAVLVLRRDPVAAGHFRAPTALPVLGIASCPLLLAQHEARVWGFAGPLLLAGAVLYALTRLADRGSGVG